MTVRRNPAALPLQRVLQRYQVEQLSDSQLLEEFVACRDEASFEALVRRHGPTVYGICRRTLGNEHDAEDAFQATFLVLARKAAAIGRREALASWLYAVAYRLALRARARAQRRRLCESQVPAPAAPAEPGEELQALLVEELSRLPEKYRAAIVLCCLQGRSRLQAADELGCSPGAVKIRLERARQALRGRLSRRGVAVPLTLLTGLLVERAGAMPVSWAATAARAGPLFAAGAKAGVVSAEACSLACGGLLMLSLTKFKVLGVLFLACTLTGAAALWTRADAQQPGGAAEPVPVVKEVRVERLAEVEAIPRTLAETLAQVPKTETFELELVVQPPHADPKLLKDVLKFKLPGEGGGGSVAFSPDQKLLAVVTGDKVRVLDVATGKVLWENALPAGAKVLFSQDGQPGATATKVEVRNVRVTGQGGQPVEAGTLQALQKLAASEDAEVRRLSAELLRRFGGTEAARNEPRYGVAVIRAAPATGATPVVVPLAQRQDNLEQRLDRLIQELQELKRQVQSKQK